MNMKRTIAIVLAVLVISLVAPAYANAQPPAIPHAFYGTLKINDVDAPVGTVVAAKGTGVTTGVDNPIVTTEVGKYGQAGLGAKLAVSGTIVDGATITFWVQRPTDTVPHEAGQTADWHSMAIEELNLTVTITVVPPTVTSVAPGSGYQGQTLNVTITGTNFTGATAVSFGTGITVNSFTVNSNTQITAGITIAGSATLGTRNVSVTTAGGTGTLTAGFTVTITVVPPSVAPNWPLIGGIIGGVIVVGLLVYFLVFRRREKES